MKMRAFIRAIAANLLPRSLVAALLIAPSLLAPVPRLDQAAPLHPPDRAIPLDFFGLHFHHLASTTSWPALPFGSWRTLAAYTDWPNLEPQKGQWNFAILDAYVGLAEKHNVSVLIPLVFTPRWASARPGEPSAYSPGNAAEPRDIEDWRNYVRVVAVRYKNRVHCYEIWNEPNLPSFFSGGPAQILRLAREAYPILKEIDPAIVVVSPSATGGSGVSWLDDYLALGGGSYADVIGFHFYVSPQPPEAMVDLMARVKIVMAAHHVAAKPLWNTEAGWFIANRLTKVVPLPHSSFSKVLSADEALAYVARSYILNWASGVSRFYWYSWDSEVGGLTEADGQTWKPSATAYTQIENWLVGWRMDSCAVDARGTWLCAMSRARDRARIAWNPSRTFEMDIPEAWSATQVDRLSGGRMPLENSTFTVGPSPVRFASVRP